MIANDTRPGPANATMLLCPVNDCPWRHRKATPMIVFGGDVFGGSRYAADQDEAAIRAHLAEHPVVDFLRTIAELRDQLAAAAVA